jgi:hypothetical protein
MTDTSPTAARELLYGRDRSKWPTEVLAAEARAKRIDAHANRKATSLAKGMTSAGRKGVDGNSVRTAAARLARLDPSLKSFGG